MSHRSIFDFAFRGMAARSVVREMQDAGRLRRPTATSEEQKDRDAFAAVPHQISANAIRMRRCYELLFMLENLVREFVVTRFTEDHGPIWFDTVGTSDMKKKVQQRKEAEEKNQWHIGRNAGDVYYLDFGDLGLLIKNQWAVFREFLPDQAWVESRMSEAERSRNVIAHTNVLDGEEIKRLEMHLQDWIRQLG